MYEYRSYCTQNYIIFYIEYINFVVDSLGGRFKNHCLDNAVCIILNADCCKFEAQTRERTRKKEFIRHVR